jgi:hypothetical protein
MGAALLPAVAACGIQPSGITSLGPVPTVPAGAAQASPTTGDSTTFVLYFQQDGQWAAVRRATDGQPTESDVLQALVQGPTATEQKEGYVSALPTGLVIRPQALSEAAAYGVSEAIGAAGRTELICTMQNFDGTDSIGIVAPGAAEPTWLACSDTTTQYIPMLGNNTFPLLKSPGLQDPSAQSAASGQ